MNGKIDRTETTRPVPLLLALIVASCVLCLPAIAGADDCRVGYDDCGPGMQCIICARGPVCAVAPAVCCADFVCGAGMICMNCPGRTACAVPPAECCGSAICGAGMRCRQNTNGQFRCTVVTQNDPPPAPPGAPPGPPPGGPPGPPPGPPPPTPRSAPPTPTAAAPPQPPPTPQPETASMTGKIDMSAIQDPEMRRQLEAALATIGDPQPGGTAAPAAPPTNQPPPPPPAPAAAPGSSTITMPPSTGAPPPPPPVASPPPGTGSAQPSGGGSLASGEYTLRGSYQMKCYSMSALPMSGSFDLAVNASTVKGLLHHENQALAAEGTVTADGQIRVAAMDAIVMTGQVNPSGADASLTGRGEIKSESTMLGESYSCSGTWSSE